ncbi:MAG: transcriptional regulator MraZ [Pseudomonadota bacterium]
MDRFLSNAINKVDKKGRVSIPASFRPKLGATSKLYTLMSVDQPSVDAGGIELIERGEKHLATLDPFSEEYELFSFVLHGDSSELNVDPEGRISLSDTIRAQTGITDKVAFVGRGYFFQIWEPDRFLAYREEARKQVANMRRSKTGGRGDGANRQGGQSS